MRSVYKDARKVSFFIFNKLNLHEIHISIRVGKTLLYSITEESASKVCGKR